MNRIGQAGIPPSAAADEVITALAGDSMQLYEVMVAQGGMVAAIQDRCQRIEEAAVPSAKVEELRSLCEQNDQGLKTHIAQFQQEVAIDQAKIQEAMQKADQAFREMNEMRIKQEQTQQSQMTMIAQEIQRQSGVQVQQTLQALQQEAAVARHELE